MDLIRGAKRSFHHTFLSGVPPAGTSCPVCLCEPDHPSEWHVTSSCCHAVCIECLQGYAKSQVQDPLHTGPLKCPVCPQALRQKDAIVAFAGNTELIRIWDEKIRNQLLRALPAYRPCPKCSERKGEEGISSSSSSDDPSNQTARSGGGFVTPACLAPHYHERRETATRIIQGVWVVPIALLAIYSSFVVVIGRSPSESALVDLFFMLSPSYFLIKCLRISQVWVAQLARKAFFRPISVECPCCDESFLLPAQTKEVADEESRQWIGAHTRPCPSCSVPIAKSGGCNHMNCPSCHASFCWACMQLRTDCRAYSCRRGAQYGNAVPGGPGDNHPAPRLLGGSILDTIDYVLDERRSRPKWHRYELGVIIGALTLRKTWLLQTVVKELMAGIATLFAMGIFSAAVLALTCWKGFQVLSQIRQRRQRGRQHMEQAYQLAGMDPADAAVAVEILQENAQDWVRGTEARGRGEGHPVRRRRRRNSAGAAENRTRNNHHTPLSPTTNRRRRASLGRRRRNSQTASEFLLGADARNDRDRQHNLRHLSEREMIQEALRRSLRDT